MYIKSKHMITSKHTVAPVERCSARSQSYRHTPARVIRHTVFNHSSQVYFEISTCKPNL